MTVTYTGEVATCRGLGCFLKLLKRWKGSIYKLVWLDLMLFLTLYYVLNILYRVVLNDHQRLLFENIVEYCKEYSTLIPLSFVLGFYVTVVMTRWWNQYTAIPFPDPLAIFVSSTIHGQDERGRVMRRTIMRYVCLCVTMVFTMISPQVKKRFPTLGHLVEAGLLQPTEKTIMDNLNKKFPVYSKHWLPLVWAASIITRARREGRVRDDFAVKTMLDELNMFRGKCGLLLSYDTISIPLVYTQVVTLAVYAYFFTSLMGHQWVHSTKYQIDLYFPVFLILEFFFYVGWLKVAETLINPFGDDDDDFEVNWMIDRNLQVSYLIVDDIHSDHPELVRDQYWDEVFPSELPHTLASEPFRGTHPVPSTANIGLKYGDDELYIPQSLRVDDLMPGDDMYSAINFTAKPGSLKRSGSTKSSGTSVPDSINNSVSGKLKRLFLKEDGVKQDDAALELAQSNNSLNKKPFLGSMKLANQVIEEVDEQMTLTSQRDAQEVRPSVMDVFGPPPPSKPVPVPISKSVPDDYSLQHNRHSDNMGPAHNFTIPKDMDFYDNISIGGSPDEADDNEFTRLKNLRQRERRNRMSIRSISTNCDLNMMEFMERRQSGTQTTPTTPDDKVQDIGL